jgi:hypothetical protein
MLGFQRFDTTVATISGIELVAIIRNRQFKVGNLPGRPANLPAIRAAVIVT